MARSRCWSRSSWYSREISFPAAGGGLPVDGAVRVAGDVLAELLELALAAAAGAGADHGAAAVLAGEALEGADELDVRVDLELGAGGDPELAEPQGERGAVADEVVAEAVLAAFGGDHGVAVAGAALGGEVDAGGEILGGGRVEDVVGDPHAEVAGGAGADAQRDEVAAADREHVGRLAADRDHGAAGEQHIEGGD